MAVTSGRGFRSWCRPPRRFLRARSSTAKLSLPMTMAALTWSPAGPLASVFWLLLYGLPRGLALAVIFIAGIPVRHDLALDGRLGPPRGFGQSPTTSLAVPHAELRHILLERLYLAVLS